MIAFFLGPRRLWWFLADWRTTITFNFPCDHCGDQIAIESHGFSFPRHLPHRNPLCRYGHFFRAIASGLRWHCRHCIRIRCLVYRFWILHRWRFRLQYNWGVGVPPECKRGSHDWGEKPEAEYDDDGTHWVTGRCRRCGFRHRWGLNRENTTDAPRARPER